jgi:hypothetical protein
METHSFTKSKETNYEKKPAFSAFSSSKWGGLDIMQFEGETTFTKLHQEPSGMDSSRGLRYFRA